MDGSLSCDKADERQSKVCVIYPKQQMESNTWTTPQIQDKCRHDIHMLCFKFASSINVCSICGLCPFSRSLQRRIDDLVYLASRYSSVGASVADYEYDCCEATATSLAATHLAGFNGELMPFTLCTLPDAETDRLPTSSTCFNKVYLPKPRTAWTSQSSHGLDIPKLAPRHPKARTAWTCFCL